MPDEEIERERIKDLPRGKRNKKRSEPDLLTPDEMDKVAGGGGVCPIGAIKPGKPPVRA